MMMDEKYGFGFNFEQWMSQFDEKDKICLRKPFSISPITYNDRVPMDEIRVCGKFATMVYGPFYRWNHPDGMHMGYQWKPGYNSDPNPDKTQGFSFTNTDGLSTALKLKCMNTCDGITLHKITIADHEPVVIRSVPRLLSRNPKRYAIEAKSRNVHMSPALLPSEIITLLTSFHRQQTYQDRIDDQSMFTDLMQ